MIDLNKQLKILMRTGKYSLGIEEAIEAARMARAKVILLASNCPEPKRGKIMQYASMSGVAVHVSEVASTDLGKICEKPYMVSAISIVDPGDSELLQLAGKQIV